MSKIFACVIAIGFVCVFAKTDTLMVVNCKCDTLKILKIDTTIVKFDTLKAVVPKKLDTLKKAIKK